MKTKLIFVIVALVILLSVAFGYQWITRSGKEEPPIIRTPPLVRTPVLERPPAEVQRAAEEGLPQFLEGLAYDQIALESYGIKSFEEAMSATLGKAHRLYTIEDLTQLANYSRGQKVSVLTTPAQTWYFAVLTNNEPRVDLNVSWHKSRWQAVGIGGSSSKQMDEIERELPNLLKTKGITVKCSLKLVEIPLIYAVFVLLECVNEEFIIPLTPTGWFNLEKGKLYPTEEAILNFTKEARRTLENPARS